MSFSSASLLSLHGEAAGLRDEALLKPTFPGPQRHFSMPRLLTLLTWAARGEYRGQHPVVDGNNRVGSTGSRRLRHCLYACMLDP
jgi:hypothetical protein